MPVFMAILVFSLRKTRSLGESIGDVNLVKSPRTAIAGYSVSTSAYSSKGVGKWQPFPLPVARSVAAELSQLRSCAS